jgi:hypothetical protein
VVANTFTFEVSSLSDFALATVNKPDVGPISAPFDPVQVNIEFGVEASFSDLDVTEDHSAEWDWGDGGDPSEGVITGASGDFSVTGEHVYVEPGVYTIILTVYGASGDPRDIGESIYQFVVVYDPAGGFVTGGGWIDSPLESYSADPTLAGKATFGFVSKYKKGANMPTGVTEFQFKVADLDFHSESYKWLLIAGKKAQFKGTGTINGEGEYEFLLSAVDGDLQGGDGIDKFRIKIWDIATEEIIYDNQMGEADNSDPSTELGGGSIVIHKAK